MRVGLTTSPASTAEADPRGGAGGRYQLARMAAWTRFGRRPP